MGKLAGILFVEFFMDFVENGLILLGEKFFKKRYYFYFNRGGVMFFRAKNLAAIRSHNYAPPFGCGRAGVMEGGLT